jgi:hypothetical protein
MPEDPETLVKRRDLIRIATQQEGAHFLLGTTGEIPGHGGLVMLPDNVDAPYDQQHFFTAKNRINKCSGRHESVEKRPKGDPRNPLHLAHLDRYRWHRIVPWIYANDLWGESCKGKRHFDCSGFANWCLKQVSTTFVNVSRTLGHRLKIRHIRELCEPVFAHGVKYDDLCVGDILTRGDDGHIGFALGEGKNKVVMAEWEASGVVIHTVGTWQFHGRLPKSYWLD